MREFRSLSLRTFDEISLQNSSVVSRCLKRNFAKTKRENSLRQREKIRRIFETSANNQKRNFACCTRNFVVWFVKISPHVRESRRVLDSGFRIPAQWIPDSQKGWIPNFFLCVLMLFFAFRFRVRIVLF